MGGRRGGIVEVFNDLVVKMGRDVGYPSGGEAKKFVFFVGYGACGGKWGGI